MKTCLVTGGAGFLGSHLCTFLLEKGYRILCIDNYITGNQNNIAHLKNNSNFVFIQHDCTKPIMIKEPIHYVGYQFELNPNNPFDDIITLHKIAGRSDFPINDKSSKGDRYNDVIFPGGTGGPKETQYFVGVEDARIGIMDLKKSLL